MELHNQPKNQCVECQVIFDGALSINNKPDILDVDVDVDVDVDGNIIEHTPDFGLQPRIVNIVDMGAWENQNQ